MGTIYKRNRDEVMLDELAARVDLERRKHLQSILEIAARARIQVSTVTKIMHTGECTTVTLLRIADALNCDVVLVRRPKDQKMWEIPGAEEQLFKLKTQQLKRKRNERQRKASAKEEFERAQRNRDFLTSGDNAE